MTGETPALPAIRFDAEMRKVGRWAIEPDGRRGHWLRIDEKLQRSLGTGDGDTVTLAVEPTKDWPEPATPEDFQTALADASDTGLESGGHHVTMSYGVAASTEGETFDYKKVFARADSALYRAKNAGRNRVYAATGPTTVETRLRSHENASVRQSERRGLVV